jgi:GTP-binding protein
MTPSKTNTSARALQAPAFLISAASARQFPGDGRPEVAFAGRSNAGKSSALNLICERRKLARTSKTPGRTQLVNFFDVEAGRLVDLPGYGFARVPPAVRAKWQTLVESYFSQRDALRGVVLIMDSRHPLTAFDEQMLGWTLAGGLPTHILLTKADKLGRGAQTDCLRSVRKALEETLATVQTFSATTRIGLDEARAQIQGWLTEPV